MKDLALLTLALFVGGMALTIYGSPFTPRYNHAPCAKGYIMVVLGAVAFTSSLPLGMITLVMAMIQGENRTKKRNEGLPLQDPVKGGE